MTDTQLLELAAKAAGFLNWTATEPAGLHIETGSRRGDTGFYWNPLTDDGDALRLAVKLRLEVGFPKENVVWSFGHTEGDISKEFDFTNPLAATRRAIVRAAAEIGKSMGEQA